MPKKPPTIGKLKKKLWAEFTLFIKLRASSDGRFCQCYTCGATMEIGTTSCHAGHWLPRGGYSYHYFNEDNVRPQCYRCNINLLGNTPVFEQALRAEIGDDKVNEIYHSRNNVEQRKRWWYEEKIFHYQQANKELREKLNA